MIRIAAALWLAIAAVVTVALFHMKYEVQRLEEELQRVHSQIRHEREAIRVLKAEWSYLNRPNRIADLAQRHLQFRPLVPGQMAHLEDLPPRAIVDAVREMAKQDASPSPARLARVEDKE